MCRRAFFLHGRGIAPAARARRAGQEGDPPATHRATLPGRAFVRLCGCNAVPVAVRRCAIWKGHAMSCPAYLAGSWEPTPLFRPEGGGGLSVQRERLKVAFSQSFNRFAGALPLLRKDCRFHANGPKFKVAHSHSVFCVRSALTRRTGCEMLSGRKPKNNGSL